MIGVALRTQCKGFAEEGSDRVNILKILSNVAFEADPREVGESRCMIGMVDWTLIQDQLKMLSSIVQVRNCLACHVFGKLCVARICLSRNLAFDDGLQSVFCQHELTVQMLISLTSICAPSWLSRACITVAFSVREG